MGFLEGRQDFLDQPGVRRGEVVALTDVGGDIVELDGLVDIAPHPLVVAHADGLRVAALVEFPIEVGVPLLFFAEQGRDEGDAVGAGGSFGFGELGGREKEILEAADVAGRRSALTLPGHLTIRGTRMPPS